MYKLVSLLSGLLVVSLLKSQGPPPVSSTLEKLDTAADASKPGIYGKLGYMYLMADKFDSALYYGNLSLEAAQKIKDVVAVADAQNNMGSIYRILSNNKKAMELYIAALGTYEKNGENRKAARTLANISIIYSEEKKFEQANLKLAEATTYATRARDTFTLVQLNSSITDNYIRLKKIDSANHFFRKAEDYLRYRLARPAVNPQDSAMNEQAKNYVNRLKANILTEEGNFQQAINVFQADLGEKEEKMGVASRVYAYKEIARNYNKMGSFRKALDYLDLSLTALKEDSIADLYLQVHELRATAYAGMGDFKSAFQSHLAFKALSDSILNDKNFQTISDLQIGYDTEKKEQEIVALNQKQKNQRLVTLLLTGGLLISLGFLFLVFRSRKLQQKLYRQEREIDQKKQEQQISELEQKALRAQMNPHFIFNSLNTVQHFVMKHDVEGVNKYLGAFAHLVRQTLNNSGRTLISLQEELNWLENYLSLEKMKSNNHFNYSITVAENIDRAGTFIPGMILQPFVENSIKHGIATKEKNTGQVSISISQNEKLVCLIEDNGIGRTRSGEIKTTTPAEMNYESRGMEITRNRIESINRLYNTDISIKIEDIRTSDGTIDGTKVTVDFPANLE